MDHSNRVLIRKVTNLERTRIRMEATMTRIITWIQIKIIKIIKIIIKI